MQSRRLEMKSVKEYWNQTNLIGLVKKEALLDYISTKLKVDKERITDRSWSLRARDDIWVPIKSTKILVNIEKEEDTILCKTIEEAKDILERKARENLSEEEAQILTLEEISIDRLEIPYHITETGYWDRHDKPTAEMQKAKKVLSETLVCYSKKEEVELWQLSETSEMKVSEFAPPDLVLEVLRKGKVLRIDWQNEKTFGPCLGSFYPDAPGVCRNHNKVFYDIKKWKSRNNYNNRAKNPKKPLVPTSIPVNLVYQIYFSLLDSFMTTGIKRFDKTPKKTDAQRYNRNNPLEELIQVYGKRYYYKLNSKSDYFRRIYKVLIILKTHGSPEKRAKALREPELLKTMKELFLIVSNIKIPRKIKPIWNKDRTATTSDKITNTYGREGYLFLRYYKMFLVKVYDFKQPKGTKR